MGTSIKKQAGRKAGRLNKGYFFKAKRGWYNSDETPLRDEQGKHVKDPKTPAAILRDLSAAYRRTKAEQAVVKAKAAQTILVEELVRTYLDYCKANNSASTYRTRLRMLSDFMTGLPPALSLGETEARKADKEAKRIHAGYGKKPVGEIRPLDIQQWVDSHPNWDGCKRFALQSVKRAFSYALEVELIESNPIAKVKTGYSRARITYFTPEQEQAIYENTSEEFARLLSAAIRTGARYGCELIALTADHVEETSNGQIWKFKAKESKTGKKTRRDRIIRIDPKLATYVREQIAKYPVGAVFRNTEGEAWTIKSAKLAWDRMKKKLVKAGGKLGRDACLYATRHTFAKRALNGYWTGKPCSFKTLALLMGNTVQVCITHYTDFEESDDAHVWAAV